MPSVLEIRPLSRVEGHGTVKVFLAGRRVEGVQLNLSESPRLFEALLVGKRYDEVPEIICRICSICSSVHRVTSLLAVEEALDIKVSLPTRLYRELIVAGGLIESHSLHLFCLALPDYFDASGFADLAVKAPEELKIGLRIKAAGNRIQETVGGRLIHPVNLIPGGMGKHPSREQLLKLRDELQGILPDAVKCWELFATMDNPLHSTELPTHRYLSIQGDDKGIPVDKQLVTSAGNYSTIADYRELLSERVIPYSNAKQCRADGEIVTVGALARLNIGAQLPSRSAQAFFDARSRLLAAPMTANNLAQAVELIQAVEQALALVDILIDQSFHEPVEHLQIRNGRGTGAIEAPRGVLIHCYDFDCRGICTAADIITPTAINQAAMEQDLYLLASALTGENESELKRQLEILVRAYDPCISCAVHVVRL